MRIAITGASGHIGAALVRQLVELGERPLALFHHDRRALEGLGLEERHVDLADFVSLRRAFDGVELVYHLAAHIDLLGQAKLTLGTNVEGTRNVLAACQQAGVKRLVHFSSIHARAPLPADEEVDERRPLNLDPRSLIYDRSKALAEAEVLGAAGFERVIVSPTGVLGPYDFKPSAAGRSLLLFGRRLLPMAIDGGFNWVDVRDVARAAITAAEKGRDGETYLLSGRWASVSELAGLVAAAAGVKAPRLVSPRWLARLAIPGAVLYARLTGDQPLFSTASLQALGDYRHISHAKAARELDFHPRPLEDTVRDAIAWFRDHGLLGKR